MVSKKSADNSLEIVYNTLEDLYVKSKQNDDMGMYAMLVFLSANTDQLRRRIEYLEDELSMKD